MAGIGIGREEEGGRREEMAHVLVQWE